jgi:hypothetical protein
MSTVGAAFFLGGVLGSDSKRGGGMSERCDDTPLADEPFRMYSMESCMNGMV